MKLERISENQIRCTLSKNDLVSRELKLSELAYGTEKAKELFNDMMTQAADELGFEADNTPLIIEAIPISGDCVILIVTKVEDPEELDARFARFVPFSESVEEDSDDDDFSDDDPDGTEYSGADEILDLFRQLRENFFRGLGIEEDDEKELAEKRGSGEADGSQDSLNIIRIFSFDSLDRVSDLAQALGENLPGSSILYKHPKSGHYYLVMEKGALSPEEFNKICNIATEYGCRERFTYATKPYYDEHYDVIIRENALDILSKL